MKRVVLLLFAAAVAVGGIAGAVEGPDILRDRRVRNLSEEEREELRQRYEKFRSLPEEERARLREKYRRFKSLSAEQRQALRERWKLFRGLPPEHRERMMERHHRWQRIPAERRKKIQERMQERFTRMSDEELGDFFHKLGAWRMIPEEEQRELFRRFIEVRKERVRDRVRNGDGHHPRPPRAPEQR